MVLGCKKIPLTPVSIVRIAMNKQEFVDYFNEHILYELLMCRYAKLRLVEGQTQILWNALFATFNVSARNLLKRFQKGCVGNLSAGRNSRHSWSDLLKELRPFPGHTIFELHKAGGITARPRQASNQAGANWIGDNYKHDRHGTGHLKQPLRGLTA
jgi:hypothetical protein